MTLISAPIQQAFAASCLHAEKAADETRRELFDTVADYIDGRMHTDTELMLQRRYPSAQDGPDSQRIMPVTLPLLQFYVDEMVDAYGNQIGRTVVNEAGKTNEQLTEIYNEALEDMDHDITMARGERHVVGQKAVGVNYEIVDNEPTLDLYQVQNVYPVQPPDGQLFKPARQETYLGFNLDLGIPGSKGKEYRVYAFSQPGGHSVYEGTRPGHMATEAQDEAHGLSWRGRPLNMFTLWHGSMPTETLIEYDEPAMFTANRTANLLFSILMDIIRFQAGATPVIESTDPDNQPTERPIGVRFAIPLQAGGGETFTFATAANDYAGLLAFMEGFVRLVTRMQGMSPGDFSQDAARAASGFAKLVDALPKVKRRKRRLRWFAVQERKMAYPRIASMLQKLGRGSGWENHRLQVQFRGESLPKPIDEVIKEHEHDIKMGFTTPARILAERMGISEMEAEGVIQENLEKSRELRQSMNHQQQPPGLLPRVGVAGAIGGRNRQQSQEQRQDERDPARRDRQR